MILLKTEIDCSNAPAFDKREWYVTVTPAKDARRLVIEHHYSKGASNTAVYTHGLYRRSDDALCGVAWWLPPTRVACESVNKSQWTKVLALSRLVIVPGVPKNACSYLLSRSVSLIQTDGRFVSLVTYADESQNHKGQIYRAANWEYLGKTKPTPRWLSPDGKQVARQSTKSRTNAQMEALGHRCVGKFHKHKFVKHLQQRRAPLGPAWDLV